MTEVTEKQEGAESADDKIVADVVAAFARLGVTVDPDQELSPEQLLERLNEAADRLEKAEAENATLSKKVDKISKATPTAKRVQAPKARRAGPIALKDGERGPSAEQLLEQVREARDVEIVFSDGKQEINGIPAIVVQGDHPWKIVGDRLKLEVHDLVVNGPAEGADVFEIDGYGLLLDGKLVAYGKRMEVARVGVGQRIRLDDDVLI